MHVWTQKETTVQFIRTKENHVRPGSAVILWGAHFDETMVALFAAALRMDGWRTKLVGLQGLEHAGRHGLKLVADLSLGQALRQTENLACLVAPCMPEVLLSNVDPRVDELLAQARRQHAVLVIQESPAPFSEVRWTEEVQLIAVEPDLVLPAVEIVLARLHSFA